MKVKIIEGDGSVKKCKKCGHTIFRKVTKSRYLNKNKGIGITYTIITCDKCGWFELVNQIEWVKNEKEKK